MRLLLRLLPLLLLCFVACKNDSSKSSEATLPIGHWYKRYTGTIAGMPVVVNFACRKKNDSDVAFSCSYYYRGKSELISLSPDSVSGRWARFTEYVPTQRDPDGTGKYPTWEITISNTGLAGIWISEDKEKTYDISLTENYDGAYHFEFIDVLDSASVKGKKDLYRVSSEYSLIVPSAKTAKEDAAFITQVLLQEMDGGIYKATTLEELIQMQNKATFHQYKETLGDLANDTDAFEGAFNNWTFSIASNCVYNDNGLVVLDIMGYNYTGGAHGNYGSRYLCVDVREKKVWHLDDILVVDTLALGTMLEKEARKSFNMVPGDTLSNTLLVDTIPISYNVIISDRGLTFHYNPYDVACYADGSVQFFLPFSQLSGMLTPAFKKRMKL